MEMKEQLEQLGFELNFMMENKLYESASIVAKELSERLKEEAVVQRKAQEEAIHQSNQSNFDEIPEEISRVLKMMGISPNENDVHFFIAPPSTPPGFTFQPYPF